MVEGHGIESCHGTAERSQEKVMVLLSVGARTLGAPPRRAYMKDDSNFWHSPDAWHDR